METNPYAPPKAAVADIASTGLKRRSVIVMILLSIVTLGLYYSIWFLRRRTALNRLDSPRKLRQWPFVVAIVWFVFQFLLGVANGIAGPGNEITGEGLAPTFLVIRLGVGILMLIQCFFTKDIIEDHLAGPADGSATPMFTETVQLSGVLTFIFQIYYLQYAINRHLLDSTSTAG